MPEEKQVPPLRTRLTSLSDDPFLNDQAGLSGTFATDEGDSIFSMGAAARRTPPQSPAPALHAPGTAATPSASAIRIKDPVLLELVRRGVLQSPDLLTLEERLKNLPAGAQSWRLAMEIPGVSREKILEVAAGIYKVPSVDLEHYPQQKLAATLTGLPLEFRKKCHALRILPFALEMLKGHNRPTLMMATPDPVRPEVLALMRSIKGDVQLYYAPAAMLNRVVQALSHRR